MPTSTSCAAAATAPESLPLLLAPDRSRNLGVIGLEALLHRLHGIVHRDLHERDVDDSDGTGPAGRDRRDRDLVPVGHRVGVRGSRAEQQATPA